MTTEATAKPKLTRERASGGRTDWVGAYAEAALGMADTLVSTVMPGLRLAASWLLSEPRPSVRAALAAMLSL